MAALSLFGDRDESVYAHYNHEVRKNMDAGQRIAELEAELERLRPQDSSEKPSESAAPAGSGRRKWWRRNTSKE